MVEIEMGWITINENMQSEILMTTMEELVKKLKQMQNRDDFQEYHLDKILHTFQHSAKTMKEGLKEPQHLKYICKNERKNQNVYK